MQINIEEMERLAAAAEKNFQKKMPTWSNQGKLAEAIRALLSEIRETNRKSM
jgi:hypothetical protein